MPPVHRLASKSAVVPRALCRHRSPPRGLRLAGAAFGHLEVAFGKVVSRIEPKNGFKLIRGFMASEFVALTRNRSKLRLRFI